MRAIKTQRQKKGSVLSLLQLLDGPIRDHMIVKFLLRIMLRAEIPQTNHTLIEVLLHRLIEFIRLTHVRT